MNLQIQCPNCSKRFTVHQDLTGKTVECGACDHRFPVRPESIIAERSKFYPGEHKDDFLDRLGRQSPIAKKSGAAPAPMQTRAPMPQVDAIMPSSPGESIAVGVGFAMLVLYTLVFFFGSAQGQAFQDVDLHKRFLMGGFVSLLGGGLIIFGARNWRGRGIMLSFVLIAGLMALIAMRPVHRTPTGVVNVEEVPSTTDEEERELKIDEIFGESDRKAMEREVARQSARLDGAPAEDYVTGIYISDLGESEYQTVEKYLRKSLMLPKSEAPTQYKRNDDKDSFVIVSGVKMDFDNMVRILERYGRVTSYPSVRVIEWQISQTVFQDPSDDLLEKLTNPEHPAFFSQNLNELGSMDYERVTKAVERLGSTPANIEVKLADKIIVELLRLASFESEATVLSNVGKALNRIAKGSQTASDKIDRLVEFWIKNEIPVQRSMVDFLIANNHPNVPAVVDRLWFSSPIGWNEQYRALGSVMEDRLIFHLQESPMEIKRAAARLLQDIGTEKSIPVLTDLSSTGDQDLRINIERALASIKSR